MAWRKAAILHPRLNLKVGHFVLFFRKFDNFKGSFRVELWGRLSPHYTQHLQVPTIFSEWCIGSTWNVYIKSNRRHSAGAAQEDRERWRDWFVGVSLSDGQLIGDSEMQGDECCVPRDHFVISSSTKTRDAQNVLFPNPYRYPSLLQCFEWVWPSLWGLAGCQIERSLYRRVPQMLSKLCKYVFARHLCSVDRTAKKTSAEVVSWMWDELEGQIKKRRVSDGWNALTTLAVALSVPEITGQTAPAARSGRAGGGERMSAAGGLRCRERR